MAEHDTSVVESEQGQKSELNIWLKGPKCSPSRLPVAIILSIRHLWRRLRRMAPPQGKDFAILGIFALSLLAVYVTLTVINVAIGEASGSDKNWLSSLILNLLGYATILVPGYAIKEYVRKTGYLEKGTQTCMEPLIRLCYMGTEESIEDSITKEETVTKEAKKTKSDYEKAITLVMCFFGLQVFYLTWGVLQEKIMTRTYKDADGNEGEFKDSQFLVFVNRILAFVIALLCISFTHQPRHKAPLYKYSFCSLSNIMSSWFQYEALKFVSFPTQVLAKASKIIPVMIMGKIVSNKKYDSYEYVVAVLISFGMVLFLLGSQDGSKSSTTTTFSGILLLMGYMTSDAFTSNWQNELFTTYKMSSIQMMCGINMFSCLLTSASLLQQGTFYTSLVFMFQFPTFTFDCVVLSVCSALGQLVLYYTISQFGPVVFTIIMTVRQAIAILLSCVIYNHPISVIGILGVLVVFYAICMKTYYGRKLKNLKKEQQQKTLIKEDPIKS